MPDGTFDTNSLAKLYKKDSWCWAGNDTLVETEDKIYARKFLQNKRNEKAFNKADKMFDKSNVLSCANKLLNEIRKFANR